MTEPPYNSDIRSNTSSGLGGLWTLLTSIANGIGSLTQIAVDVAAIRVAAEAMQDRLQFLVGDGSGTPDWLGLPNYLVRGFGTPQHLEDYGNYEYYIGELYTNTYWTMKGLRVNPPEAVGDDSFLRLGNLKLDAMNAKFDALNLVTGTIAAAPNGATLKSLLAAGNDNTLRSAVCCEDGAGSTPPPDSSNPTPAAFCNGGATQRVVSWKFLNEQTVGGVQANVYRAVFNFSPAALLPLTGFDSSRPAPSGPAIQMPVDANATYCIAWNFAGQTAPLTIGRYIGTSSDAAQDNIVTSNFLVGASTTTVGGESFDFNNCGGVASFLSFNATFALGVTPPLSFFIGVSQNRGCPV